MPSVPVHEEQLCYCNSPQLGVISGRSEIEAPEQLLVLQEMGEMSLSRTII
jgi:hypothetical protein